MPGTATGVAWGMPEMIEVTSADGPIRLAVRTSPAGKPPLLLLHGFPQTHRIWDRLWDRLAARWTLVAPDLRGYGDSAKPAGTPDHATYSKRTMAADAVALMQALGHERFAVVGHDRGGRVAHRLAMDHPAHISRIAVLDIAPTLAMYEGTTEAFARAYWHWFFLIQPAPFPEMLLAGHGPMLVRAALAGKSGDAAAFDPEAMAEYMRCASDPAMIHAACEDYRAAASIDLEHDRADRDAGRRLAMPLLVVWGASGVVARCFDVLGTWQAVGTAVRGVALPCGHYPAEEAPALTGDALEAFLGEAD